jgi:two-component system chemotaxis response regulator CheB
MKALELGAVDFIPKTSGSLSLDIEKVAKTIIGTIKVASKVKVKASAPAHNIMDHHLKGVKGDRLVLIGSSTGGPKALPEVLSRLPGDIPAAILVVQHMPEGFTKSFAERLNWSTSLDVKEAEEGDELKRGHVLIAPGNRHMEVVGNHVHLNDDPKIHFVRPAVDVMMKTAAPIYGKKIVGVVLTGMGYDGAEGMKMIKEFGGRTIVQDEATCVVYGMPKAVVDSHAADMVVPLEDIADHIMIALKD